MEDVRPMRVTVPAVRESERGLASLVDALDPDAVAFADAANLWKAFDSVERLAASAKVLLAARVEAAGAWKQAGARSAAEHLARMGGTTTSVARRSLEVSRQVADLPRITDALRGGVLSAVQVDAIASAAAADPAAEDRLLCTASTTSVTELREECLTKAAADPDRDATHGRIHANRAYRTYADAEGAWNLVARGTAESGARFEAAIEPIVDEMFAIARAEGRRESREAYAFDALMTLVERDSVPAKKPNMRYLAILRVDLAAMERGAADGLEVCEIAGIGPVPVQVARDLLGESIVKLVIAKGVDVLNVTHLGRGATAAQRIALLWSKPKCASVECSCMFVQIDHRIPWATSKHTRLDELDPLCPHHHKLKTNQNWSLVDGTGRRLFVGPNDARHPRNRPPP